MRAYLALAAGATIVALAGCAGGNTVVPSSRPVTAPALAGNARPAASHYRRLFSFGDARGSCADGAWPDSALVALKGSLYGTTYAGGNYSAGTIFSFTPGGAEQVFYSFEGSGRYGGNPLGGVTLVNGKFYGTTPGGGNYGAGVAYKIRTNSPIPIEQILHGFGNGNDGAQPLAGLIASGDRLYGTTSGGGANGLGTVFVVDAKSGKERVLHDFAGGSDGAAPQAPLLVDGDGLYGTTNAGGPYNAGTVFRVNTRTGAERVLHAFTSLPDGANPQAGLVLVNGTLYGTTEQGGNSGSYGGGTLFRIGTDGKNERVLHSFGAGTDGRNPLSAPIAVNGTLYGTTSQGGLYSGSRGYSGTLYSFRLSDGKERVLHDFGNGSDGAFPWSSPVDFNGTLYGATAFGGDYFSFCVLSAGDTVGTVYRWTL